MRTLKTLSFFLFSFIGFNFYGQDYFSGKYDYANTELNLPDVKGSFVVKVVREYSLDKKGFPVEVSIKKINCRGCPEMLVDSLKSMSVREIEMINKPFPKEFVKATKGNKLISPIIYYVNTPILIYREKKVSCKIKPPSIPSIKRENEPIDESKK